MARKPKKRRQPHGSASHWKQTNCWYYTESGTNRRVPRLDEDGQRIRGMQNKEVARLATALVKLADELSRRVQHTRLTIHPSGDDFECWSESTIMRISVIGRWRMCGTVVYGRSAAAHCP